METIGIRKLKNRLSEYLRAAQSGTRITVTSHGVPVADLVPHTPQGLRREDELLRLARSGEVRLGAAIAENQYSRPPKDIQIPHDEVMEILDSIRGDT